MFYDFLILALFTFILFTLCFVGLCIGLIITHKEIKNECSTYKNSSGCGFCNSKKRLDLCSASSDNKELSNAIKLKTMGRFEKK